MANIDAQLINRTYLEKEEEDAAAGEMRKRRNLSRQEDTPEAPEEKNGREEESIRDQLLRRRTRASEDGSLSSTVSHFSGAGGATKSLLRQSWIWLIPSWGLTLIWINIHMFLGVVLGKNLFCRLGEEWMPRQVARAGGETPSKAIGMVERMGVVLLDVLAIFLILLIIVIIFYIIDLLSGWFGFFLDVMTQPAPEGIYNNVLSS